MYFNFKLTETHTRTHAHAQESNLRNYIRKENDSNNGNNHAQESLK